MPDWSKAESIAEWILRRITTRERAAAIVGDMLESEGTRGLLSFWIAVSGVVVSQLSRPLLALVAAFYIAAWTLQRLAMGLASLNASHPLPHHQTHTWYASFDGLILIVSMLSALMLYAAIRYGLKDGIAQLSFAWTCLAITALCFWWQPAILAICIAGAALLLSASMRSKPRRRESLVLIASVAIGTCLKVLALLAGAIWQFILTQPRHPWGQREMDQHLSFQIGVFLLLVVSFWLSTKAWSRLHDWLMHEKDADAGSNNSYPLPDR